MDVTLDKTRRQTTAKALLWLSSTAFVLSPLPSYALGLGKIQVRSALNQALNADIPLLAAKPADLVDLEVRISAQSFAGQGIAGANFDYTVETRDRTNVIHLTSGRPIREPVLNFLVEVEWPSGRLLREFAVLLNPPSFVTRTEPRVAPVAKLVDREPSKAKPRKPEVAAGRPEPTRAPAPAVQPAAPVARSEPPAAPKPEVDSSVPDDAPTYRVKRGDTLWNIATGVLPNDSVSVQQMMQALLEANPQAFVRNDINALKAGATLRLPTVSGLAPAVAQQPEQRVAETEVKTLVAEQPAVAAEPTPEPEVTVAATDTPDPVEPAKPEVRLLPPETGQPPIDAATLTQVDVRPQLRVASIEELQSRIDRLADTDNTALTAAVPGESQPTVTESAAAAVLTATATAEETDTAQAATTTPETDSVQIPDGSAVLAENDRQATAEQTASEPAQPAVATAAGARDAPDVESAAEPMLAESATTEVATDAEAGSTTTSAGGTDTTAIAATGTAAAMAADGQETALAAAPEAPTLQVIPGNNSEAALATVESDWFGRLVKLSEDPAQLLEDPTLLAAVGGPIALLLLLVLWLFARRSPEEEAALVEEATVATPLPAVQRRRARSQTTKRQSTGAAPGAGAVGAVTAEVPTAEQANVEDTKPFRPAANPLERVDLLLAVGNYREAENVARLALAEDPEDRVLMSKMLDVHFAANNSDKFQEDAERLHNLVGNTDDSLWRHAVQMGRQLCPDHPLFLGAAGAAASLADNALQAPEETTLQTDVESTVLRAHAAKPVVDAGITRQIDLPTDDAAAIGDETLPQPAVSPNGLDFEDFDFHTPEIEAGANAKIDTEITQVSDLNSQLDELEFSLDSLAAESPDPDASDESLKLDNTLDFEFDDLFDDPIETPLTQEAEIEGELKDMGFEFEQTQPVDDTPIDDVDLSQFGMDGGDAAADQTNSVDALNESFLGGDDGVDTKLELATAYLDMDDSEGARSLLDEVLQEGSDAQQQRAKELLERLAG